MGKAEYIVMGAWAVQAKTGKVRHLPCRRWCNHYNENDKPIHSCDALDDDPIKEVPIPAMVVTVSECLRKGKQDASV